MVHARDASEEEGAAGEERDPRSRRWVKDTEHHKDLGHNYGDEDLEDALDPHVDDPKAPVVHDCQVGLRVVHQTRGPKEGDEHGRAGDSDNEVP